MFLTTIGHATLLLSEQRDGAPLLVTDPWLLGSCYWRSWWLERYPSQEQIERVRSAANIYFTHEHPDHFHTPSVRRVGAGPSYLVPDFSRDRMGAYLREHGFRASTVPAAQWVALSAQVRVLSVPTIGNDSVLLIDTPHALIANLNDARPTPDQLSLLRRVRRSVGRGKRCILLASYSAAGIGNSLYRDTRRLSFASGGLHTRYLQMLARVLEVDAYVPFASHVRFERPDTRWANAFRVSTDEVERALTAQGVQFLPPYLTLDLATFEHSSEAATQAASEPRIEERVQAQIAGEAPRVNADDIAKLEQKLNAAGRLWLPLLFPRGIAFQLPEQRLHYNPLSGRVRESDHSASVVLHMPAQPLKDVLASGFFSDLCIPMFTHVHLGAETLPHAVYAFFTAMQLHDVGATSNLQALARSIGSSFTERKRLWSAIF